ncbi:Clp protease proteolytic subunit /translocation-enhancing protein tepA [Fadolivirus algeromassiliense]|jgi:ATP-dependent protease ClpP protease subunit|uniref:Clp protease proteolytic subunit /translocation-enhancing protein tepA n=1 Tax=Fadolivirus FV1/VV64 TaxID=3070911 RepID=A0A7D3QV32_9VIRU|nr:Clp protease proteolytic subunit /translocation-enhancing protein tepA [Fadolivirus algeromassiliense]QKF94705.1 Clp protease proteolytic subunit /translocation-enhancing protein tepA [Fadolivirus FV1/VV64]
METLYWGFESAKPQKNNKRTFSDYDQPDYEEPRGGDTKKIKLFKEVNKMIYSIGNEIHFNGTINTESIEAIIKKMTKLINKNKEQYDGTEDKCNITYVVDSGGGSVTAILKFVDFIKMSKKKYPWLEFTSVITGCAASAATTMCVVADHRHITPHATCMIHELSSGRSGTYTHLQSYSQYLTILHETLLKIYLEKCHKSKEEIERLLATETWYNAQQYLAAGFVDKVVDI